ncbi:MAG: glucose-6-phosphate isomerase, partial [Peptococcia bacterium]
MNWLRFQKHLYHSQELGLMLDCSRMNYGEQEIAAAEELLQQAHKNMTELEQGTIANPDEDRMVGHYWLRNPQLAPRAEIVEEIELTIKRIKEFADNVHTGKIKTPSGQLFRKVLIIGIGGSALGPQFVSDALKVNEQKMKLYFLDNTDPDGIDMILSELGQRLAETLVI